MPKLLVVDDEAGIRYSFTETLGSPELTVLTAATAAEGVQAVQKLRPDVVIMDVRLPDQSGLDAFAIIHEIDPRIPVIIITAFARTETAIEAMRRGAFEYLLKPVDFQQLKSVVTKALEVSRLSRTPTMLADSEPEDLAADRLVGASPAMQDVYKVVGRIAPQDTTVLILGESGTGKELVARALYHYSRRSDKPFLAINCAALPETLLESELFGHERGAFTGADQRRIGKFEQLHGGTIFLDEIGDMAPATQAKALRLLQQQQFERIGGNATITTDVRLIAATNQNLSALVESGRFRQDLFYRLSGFTIHLPPLRERLDDLPILTDHFLRVANRDLGKSIRGITDEARRILQQHTWPGNVRELFSAIRYAVVQAAGEVITPDCLPASCGAASAAESFASPLSVAPFDLTPFVQQLLASGESDVYSTVQAEVDRVVVTAAMSHTGGNQAQAAQALGISRMTLRSKLRSLGLLNDKANGEG